MNVTKEKHNAHALYRGETASQRCRIQTEVLN